MKKVITLLFSAALILLMLSACGSKTSAVAHKKVAGYDTYAVKVKSIKEDKDNHEFTVTGTTDAPNGAKIYAVSPDSSYIEYGSNAGSSPDDVTDWAKVKDGKFTVKVDPNDLYYGRFRTGQKVQADIVAIKGFDQGMHSTYQFTKSQMNKIKDLSTANTFTITDEIRDYLNAIYDNSESSSNNTKSDIDSLDDLSTYNTGITFDQLSRTPDKYEGKKVKFTGKVLQVIEDDDKVLQLRLAVDGNYDNVVFVGISRKNLKDYRILENDKLTIYGLSDGIYSYTSTQNTTISIPSVFVVSYDDDGKAPYDYGI